MLSKITMSNVLGSQNNIQQRKNPSFTGAQRVLTEGISVSGVTVKYFLDNDIFTPMQKLAKGVLADFTKRAGVKGQFLNWVMLPEQQLNRGLKRIYDAVGQSKAATGNDKLTVLGLGGSKHPLEYTLNLSNLSGKRNVHFYSDIDPLSFKSFKEEIGGNLRQSNYLVVSKSGTTFETEDAYVRIERGLVKEYKKMGYTTKDAQALADKHFVVVSDANETSSKLRKIANQKGYIGELFIHDDVGGRYSAMDDHGLFALAWAGLSKQGMTKMLKGAAEMTKNALSGDLKNNMAMQRGIFYADSFQKGVTNLIHGFFGRHFEGGAENWLKQLYSESLKSTLQTVLKMADGMHHTAEAIFDPRNKYNITGTAFDTKGVSGFKNYTVYVRDMVMSSFAKIAPTSLELLKINKKGVTPEALGAYTQLKHFETVYQGMLRRAVNGEAQPAVLDEVLQPSVEAYKRANRGADLVPGR